MNVMAADCCHKSMKREPETIEMKKVSFVIPCYRSAQTLPHVVKEIDDTMSSMKDYCYEIIMVK